MKESDQWMGERLGHANVEVNAGVSRLAPMVPEESATFMVAASSGEASIHFERMLHRVEDLLKHHEQVLRLPLLEGLEDHPEASVHREVARACTSTRSCALRTLSVTDSTYRPL